MEVVQGICNLEADGDYFFAGELGGLLEFIFEGFALDVFHDEVVAVGIADTVVDGGDMLVGEGGEYGGLAFEGLDGVLTFLVVVAEAIDHFGDDAQAIAEMTIAGEVDYFLAALAEKANDLVATEEDIAWGSDWIPSLGIGHGAWLFAGGDFGFDGGEEVLGEEAGAAVTEADGLAMGEGDFDMGAVMAVVAEAQAFIGNEAAGFHLSRIDANTIRAMMRRTRARTATRLRRSHALVRCIIGQSSSRIAAGMPKRRPKRKTRYTPTIFAIQVQCA